MFHTQISFVRTFNSLQLPINVSKGNMLTWSWETEVVPSSLLLLLKQGRLCRHSQTASSSDRANADRANADKSNADKSNADKANADKSNADRANADKSNADSTQLEPFQFQPEADAVGL